jgi:predicted outer membrane repeat protein
MTGNFIPLLIFYTPLLSCSGTIMEGNGAGGSGGGMQVSSGAKATLHDNVLIKDNDAESGGGIHVRDEGTLQVGEASLWINNTALVSDGGGLSVADGGQATVGKNCTFEDNVASHAGGALSVHNSSKVTIVGESLFKDNMAVAEGGACFVCDGALVNLGREAIITRNTAPAGSAVGAATNGEVKFGGYANVTGNRGGPALSIDGATLHMGKVGRPGQER